MMLLIDVGNTRIKWAVLQASKLERQSARAHADFTIEDLSESIAHQAPERVLVANVGGPKMAALLADGARRLWGVQAQFVHSVATLAGVRNGYAEPAQLGVDRWLALVGAYIMFKTAVCVVDVGTAMTIDGVDAVGQHLGGLIVPGPDLMVASLLRNTSDIAGRAAQGKLAGEVFADNTLGGIRLGAELALVALIERTLASQRQQLAVEPILVITGGAGPLLQPRFRCAYRCIPDLVLRGLAAAG